MRRLVPFAVLVALSLQAAPACASSDSTPPTLAAIQALETRARQAQPREQCFLYAELVHQMTELSVRQYTAGNIEAANGLLRKIQQAAQKIHLTVAEKDKRLKNAEILLSRTAFRLNEMLHASDYEDRQLVAQTLAEVNQAQNEAMLAVFQQ